MPFTPPATVKSKANSGYLAMFYLGDTASPPVFTAVSEIKSFSADGFSMPEISNTHLLSPNNTEEFVPGMLKPGKVAFTGNFIGDASQLQISTLGQAQTIFPFKIVAPVQRNSKTYTFQCEGFFTAYKPGPFENNKAIEFSGEIQMTGAYTETVA